MIFNALIIEDEIPARVTLKSYLRRYFNQIQIAGEVDTVKGAVEFLMENDVEIIFLDVQLKDGLGVELFKQVKPDNYKIIFTTAYEEYTRDAFQLKSFGYLLKPLAPSDFKEIVNRVLKDLMLTDVEGRKIKVPVKGGDKWIDLRNIIRCESESNYTKVYCRKIERPFTLSKTLKYVETNMINTRSFIRVHQSHLINRQYIESSEIKENTILLTTGERIPISRSRKSELIEILKLINP